LDGSGVTARFVGGSRWPKLEDVLDELLDELELLDSEELELLDSEELELSDDVELELLEL